MRDRQIAPLDSEDPLKVIWTVWAHTMLEAAVMRSGLATASVAARSKISYRKLHRAMLGERELRMGDLAAVAATLGCEVAQIMDSPTARPAREGQSESALDAEVGGVGE